DLQNTKIDEFYNPKYLKFNKVNENSSVEELYSQCFIISGMENINFHPEFEWLHYVKLRLGFPVTVSIRVDNVPNEMVKKRHSNVKLEIEDQVKEAAKGGQNTDLLVDEAGRGVIRL